jgi:hypothetical protein
MAFATDLSITLMLAETKIMKWAAIILMLGAGGCVTPTPPPLARAIVAPGPFPALGFAQETRGEIEIMVQGTVRKTGVYRFQKDEPCTMMHLLFKMAGLPAHATGRNATIQRKNADGIEVEIKVNIRELMETGEPEKDVPLKHGDRVIFEDRLLAI